MLKILLWPFSLLYGCVMEIRNFCFDKGWLKTRSFDIPLISVGNLAVGGTGKTPHTEYLIRLLQNTYRIATLSRGYGRKTKGFLQADATTTSEQVGDEPFQMMSKFPQVLVSVDENRCEGVENLLQTDADVILLDDAFQHRYVKAGLSILLTDFHNLYYKDMILPAGRLREAAKNSSRADVIVVTKCPKNISESEKYEIPRRLKLQSRQEVYFSTFEYESPKSLFSDNYLTYNGLKDKSVLLVTGIAHPETMVEYLSPKVKHLEHLRFPDHYDFSAKDFAAIESKFEAMNGDDKIVITTDKDAARINEKSFSEEVMPKIYSLGVRVKFLEREESFNQKILSYVEENRRSR